MLPTCKRIAGVLFLASLVVAIPAVAQQRAYAPENLRTLSYNDQVRVISLEYSEQSSGRRIPDDQLRFYLDQVSRSNWGFSRIKQDIAQSLGGDSGTQPPVAGTIRCESLDGRAQTCSTPWAGPSRLVRQLSGARCEEGRSWQSQQGQVYVGNGCRGEFAAAPVEPPGSGSIRCESNNSNYNSCATPWRGKSQLSRQLSGAACVEGRSWGSSQGQVWVSHGCRAEFIRGVGGGSNYTVTCSSSGSPIPTTCAWDRRRGNPYLLEQLSNARCIENLTWGYNTQRGLWVSAGCRARFSTR